MPKKNKTPKKPKKKLSPEQKAEKRRRKAEFETVFINGKQKRVRRAQPLVDGLPADEFIRRNADPIWLHQNELWEYMEPFPESAFGPPSKNDKEDLLSKTDESDCEIPF